MCINWGTLPDWLMVITTIITGILLWKTLIEQKKILKEQEKINKFSINKDKRDIRPEFKIKYDSGNYFLYLTNATAINVHLLQTNSFFKTDYNADSDIINVWHKEYNQVKIPYPNPTITDRQYSIWTINYKDEDGRNYEQHVNGDNNGVFIDFPKLTKDII